MTNLTAGRKGGGINLTIQVPLKIMRDYARCGGVVSNDLYLGEGLASHRLVWDADPLGV